MEVMTAAISMMGKFSSMRSILLITLALGHLNQEEAEVLLKFTKRTQKCKNQITQ
jgi:hypothetical protein